MSRQREFAKLVLRLEKEPLMGKHRKPKIIVIAANNPPKMPRPKPPVAADITPKIKLPKAT